MLNDIPAVFSKILIDLLLEMGVHPSQVLSGTGVQLNNIADLNAMINIDQQLAIYNNALRVSGSAELGLLHGQRMMPSHLGVVGYAVQTSANLGQALRTLVNYGPLSGSLMDFEIKITNNLYTITAHNISARGPCRQYIIEEHFVTIDRILKIISGGKFSPTRISFDYPCPPCVSLYKSIFKCPVDFDKPANVYEFDIDMLDLAVILSDSVAAKACQKRCEEIVGHFGKFVSSIDIVRQLILKLPSHARHLNAVAEELNISPRSLRRKLAEEGTTFQSVLNEVRLELALEYLKDPSLHSEEIGLLLGFSDGAGFRHAFKKWTGQSPSSFRMANMMVT